MVKEKKQGDRPLVGLALGGGAARGFAHIGVLKVLEEERIPIDFVAGTSIGSLIGALHCAGVRWQEIVSITNGISWGDLVKPAWPNLGLVRSDRLEAVIGKFINQSDFEDLAIPFKAVAVDIVEGQAVILGHGAIAPAVRASCSIPGIFSPVELDGRLLVDGGVLNSVPADVVKDMGADVVIAVNLNADRKKHGKPENVLDMMFYSFSLMIAGATDRTLRYADIVIEPDLHDMSYYALKKKDVAIARGESAARSRLAAIRERIME
ncbi:MAG TPA: patatin-like phospholipase family protein [Spirochaetia bacterium]|nr:patatin-like phospholipase family protein [Spirochaetia bacterium]